MFLLWHSLIHLNCTWVLSMCTTYDYGINRTTKTKEEWYIFDWHSSWVVRINVLFFDSVCFLLLWIWDLNLQFVAQPLWAIAFLLIVLYKWYTHEHMYTHHRIIDFRCSEVYTPLSVNSIKSKGFRESSYDYYYIFEKRVNNVMLFPHQRHSVSYLINIWTVCALMNEQSLYLLAWCISALRLKP